MSGKNKLLNKLNGIVKMDNGLLNTDFVRFSSGWTSFDLDWWIVLEAQVVDQQGTVIEIPNSKVQELFATKKHKTFKEFVNKTNKTFSKFLTLQIQLETKNPDGSNEYRNINIFQQSYIDTKKKLYVVQLSDKALPYFNDLATWTRFALEQSTALRTTYAKRLFMFLKQWRTIGKVTFSKEDFVKKMDIPSSYTPGNIDQRVIGPALEELAPYFMQLHVQKNYVPGKRGHKLAGYTFTWRRESKTQNDIMDSKILTDTYCIYSIMSNRYMNMSSKFTAIDKYRGLKIGTTEDFYKEHHPNTYFVDAKKYKKRSILNRHDLHGLKSYTTKTLYDLAQIYEKLNADGSLLADDLKDLDEIEYQLFSKYVKLAQSQSESSRSIEQNSIAGYVFNAKDIYHQDYKADEIKDTISSIVLQDFAKNKRGQDKRNLEIKLAEKL